HGSISNQIARTLSVDVIFLIFAIVPRVITACLSAASRRPGPSQTRAFMAPGLTGRQIFLSNKKVLGGAAGGVGLARLICTRCRKDVKSVLRCRSCGTLCPTSEIGAAMLSPSAFAFYGLISIVVAIFWFA